MIGGLLAALGRMALAVSVIAPPIGQAAAAIALPEARVTRVQQEDWILGSRAFEKVRLERDGAPALTFYISKPPRPAPLLLYIQGSGCSPVFVSMGGQPASTVYSFVPTAETGRFATMVVDKPLVPTARPASGGAAVDCPREFNEYFSFAAWARDLHQAFEFARTMPWVDVGRSMVLGFSEGAVMAANLAGTDSNVSDVALLGATGPSQLFDFIVAAYREGKNDGDVLARINEVESTARLIAEDPDNATKFAWGHPYKRWSGFLAASTDRMLMNSRARMYLVSGMGDANVPILSTEALYSDLASAGKRVTFRRIPDASHMLLPAGGKDFEQLGQEIERTLTWFDTEGK